MKRLAILLLALPIVANANPITFGITGSLPEQDFGCRGDYCGESVVGYMTLDDTLISAGQQQWVDCAPSAVVGPAGRFE